MGGSARPAPGETFEKLLRAINIQTGEIAWEVAAGDRTATATASAGVLSTASGLVFFGENSGSFMAADARNGKVAVAVPDQPGVESFADDLHVRQQAICGDRGGARHRGVRAAVGGSSTDGLTVQPGNPILVVRDILFLPPRLRDEAIPKVLPYRSVLLEVNEHADLTAFVFGNELDSGHGFIFTQFGDASRWWSHGDYN